MKVEGVRNGSQATSDDLIDLKLDRQSCFVRIRLAGDFTMQTNQSLRGLFEHARRVFPPHTRPSVVCNRGVAYKHTRSLVPCCNNWSSLDCARLSRPSMLMNDSVVIEQVDQKQNRGLMS